MTWFQTDLEKRGAEAVVRIDGLVVSVDEPGRPPARREYERVEQAWCVYEANVDALVQDGFAEQAHRTADEAPGALADWATDQDEDLYWARWREGRVVAAGVDAADPVALEDGTLSDLRRARKCGRFDRKRLDPVWEIDHALRRLLHHPRAAAMEASPAPRARPPDLRRG